MPTSPLTQVMWEKRPEGFLHAKEIYSDLPHIQKIIDGIGYNVKERAGQGDGRLRFAIFNDHCVEAGKNNQAVQEHHYEEYAIDVYIMVMRCIIQEVLPNSIFRAGPKAAAKEIQDLRLMAERNAANERKAKRRKKKAAAAE